MIVELDRFEQEVRELEKKLDETASAFDVDAMRDELDQLHREMEQPDFWNNLERAQKVNQRIKTITDRTQGIADLRAQCEDAHTLIAMCDEEQDESLVPEIESEIQDLTQKIGALYLSTLLRGEYDANDCILSLHAGAGGTEAQDWTQMLYRMYTRYAERHGYQVRELDFLEGDEAGIKSVTFEVKGENAYGYLKAERGVHRLVRISPFDSAARRHTSFASLDVMPVLPDDGGIVIKPEDLRIDTYRAGGAGGQHVNRTDSHGLGRAHHAHPDRHRRPVPERAQPDPEPRAGHGRAPRAPGRAARARKPGEDERDQGRAQEDRVGQPDPLLRLPALYHGQGSPHRL